MLRLLIALALTGLTACAPVIENGLPAPGAAAVVGAAVDATGARPPAPGARTLVDDKALLVALQSADALASTVDALVQAGVLVPGSPRALAVRDGLARLKAGLEAASAAQRAGEALTYQEALRNAAQAAQDIAAAIRGR